MRKSEDLLKRFLLAVAAIACASLVSSLMADTIFPSDGRDPKLAGGAVLLAAVCPDRVDSGLGCRRCPEFTPFGGEDFGHLQLDHVTRGHFLSPTSEDAILSVSGCESHQEGFGGTILLTRRSQRWKMLWYKPGVKTSQCHTVSLRNRREILVCIDQFFGHGNNGTTIYTEDLRNPAANGMREGPHKEFFALRDDSACCSFYEPSAGDPMTWGNIEKVEFGTNTAGGPPAISVTANFAKGVWTAETIRDRLALERLLPLRRYHIDFIFDGQDYKSAEASVATARIFADP